MENKVNEVLNVSMEKIKQMVDVSTVVGDQIRVSDDLTVIPVSKVSYGFAGGGSDLPSKNAAGLFGGGSGAGVNITPIALIVIQKNDVRLIPVTAKPGSADQIIHMVPDVINKISGLVHKDKHKDAKEENTAE